MRSPRRFTWVAFAFGAIAISSCSKTETRKPTFPVTGKVLLSNGKPAENASIVFHPIGESGPDIVRPRGKVGPDGSFKSTTYDTDDGAPAGEYQVTLELWLSSGRGDEGPTNRLPQKYGKSDTSGIVVTVNPSPTELMTIQLQK